MVESVFSTLLMDSPAKNSVRAFVAAELPSEARTTLAQLVETLNWSEYVEGTPVSLSGWAMRARSRPGVCPGFYGSVWTERSNDSALCNASWTCPWHSWDSPVS